MSDNDKTIWKATAPKDFATRQLYVDGKIATRARYTINLNDFSSKTDGLTFLDNGGAGNAEAPGGLVASRNIAQFALPVQELCKWTFHNEGLPFIPAGRRALACLRRTLSLCHHVPQQFHQHGSGDADLIPLKRWVWGDD